MIAASLSQTMSSNSNGLNWEIAMSNKHWPTPKTELGEIGAILEEHSVLVAMARKGLSDTGFLEICAETIEAP